MVHGWYVDGTWMVHGWYVDDARIRAQFGKKGSHEDHPKYLDAEFTGNSSHSSKAASVGSKSNVCWECSISFQRKKHKLCEEQVLSSSQIASQQTSETWRPLHRLKAGVWKAKCGYSHRIYKFEFLFVRSNSAR